VRHPSPLVIPTGAYPDFLLRAASDDHAMSLNRKSGGG
jgi:hypothetical protein